MSKQYDAVIIGAGQAGPSLAGRLTKAGQKVAFVERKLFGGTCVNTGCTPTKALVASAYVAHKARTASQYGVQVSGDVHVDMRAVKARMRQMVEKSRKGVEGWLRNMENCTVYAAHARFESPNTLRVGEELIQAEKIYLNVGGRAAVPSFAGIESVPFLTNTGILELEELPKHLVIVGGSYIGIEFAQMYRRFGSEVTIIEKSDRLLHKEDSDVSSTVKEILEKEGVHIRLGAECICMSPHPDGVAVGVNCSRDASDTVGSHLLLAVGRRPNTDDLALEKAGVVCDEHGYIQVDDQLKTNVSHIWAMGDCHGRGGFTHTSYNDFEIIAGNLLDGEHRKVSDRILAYAVYMDPPLARVGLTEAEVRSSGRPALIGTRPMTKVARAVEKGESDGFMKVLIDGETRQILGAALLGTGGDEAIHCILDVMYARAPYTTIQRAVHIHPTVSELIPTVLGDLKPLS